MTRPEFRFFTEAERASFDPATTLCVDGVVSGFRTLSHWPGNDTPRELARDLSTDIVLAYAALAPEERERLVGPAACITNNHYDTDGALSAFAACRPADALERRAPMLAAAATGDFMTWNGEEALAVDLTVMRLLHAPGSSIAAEVARCADDAQRWDLGYRWLIEHLPRVLDDPFAFRPSWSARFDSIRADVARVEDGRGPDVEPVPALDLAIVTLDAPTAIETIALHHAVGDANRVLLVAPGGDRGAGDGGARYRLVYRDESWFELVSRQPAPRVPLEPIAARLQALEDNSARARGPADAVWWCTGLELPVASLGFGAADVERSPFGELDLAADPPSRLPRETVIEVIGEALAAAPHTAS